MQRIQTKTQESAPLLIPIPILPKIPDFEMQSSSPLKPWKHPLTIPIPIFSMRGLLLISIFGAFSLFYLSSFPSTRWHANDCRPNVVVEEERTNLSHILFGIAGSAETWATRRRYCELWWKPNATRGFVWLDRKPAEEWPETSPQYRISADTARFKYTNWYGSRSAVRIARIVKESFELGLGNVRWFVMGDDDTVFFTENLVDLLNRYDHKQMYYIGGNSESVEQNVVHSYNMAYGGGGFAISYPLAAALVRILDGCVDRYAAVYGSDLKIGACVNEIGVPVTRELGFHQMDIRGSPLGLLSAHPMAPLISLHHLEYVQPIFPGRNRVESVKRLMEAYKRDPSRALQQSFCYEARREWTVSVSWGYNVQLYPFPVAPKDLSTPLQTFLTWGSWSQEPFAFNTRPVTFDPCQRPLIHYLHRAHASASASVTASLYTRPHPPPRTLCNHHSYAKAYLVKAFNVTAPLLHPPLWNKGPRRQCCEIINGSDEVDGVLQVRIRGCKQWESVTPSFTTYNAEDTVP